MASSVAQHTAGAAGSALAFLSTLPRECKLATVHASAICAGENPAYYSTPGFGPFAVCYGWLALGMMIRIVVAILIMMCAGYSRHPPGPPPTAIAPPTVPLMPPNGMGVAPPLPALAPTPEEAARLEVIRALAAGGQAVLQQRAQLAGLTETEFLRRLTGLPALAPAPQPPGPAGRGAELPRHAPY